MTGRFALAAELADTAFAIVIPCRHCVGERDLRRLNCWRHAWQDVLPSGRAYSAPFKPGGN
jgi:hypothetical protein